MTNGYFSRNQNYLASLVPSKIVSLKVKEHHLEREQDCLVEEEICLMMLKETRYLCST